MFDSLDPKHLIYGLLRLALSGVGSWLLAHGVTAGQWEQILLAVAALLAALVWSLLNKINFSKKIQQALDLPAGSPPSAIK